MSLILRQRAGGKRIIPASAPAAPPVAPLLVSQVIEADGETLLLTFDMTVTGNTGFTLDPSGGAATLTYVSGVGTTALTYSISRVIENDEDVELDYTAGNVTADAPLATITNREVTNQSAQGDPPNFTVIAASGDSRIIYVSTADGNDSDDGLSEGAAKLTIAAGLALMRSGYPDRLLLKRGDTFTPTGSISPPSGRSPAEPSYLGTYGSGARPIITGPTTSDCISLAGKDNIACIGWHLLSARVLPTGGTSRGVVSATGAADDWFFFEDMIVEGFRLGFSFDSSVASSISNVTIRRCIVIDNWGQSSHSQGIFADDVDGLTIEECFISHNGWKQGATSATADDDGGPTVFNHGMYLTHYCRDVNVLNNIITDSSNLAIKFQPNAGTHSLVGNACVRNSSGIQCGGGQPPQQAGTAGCVYTCEDNVILEGLSTDGISHGIGGDLKHCIGGTFSNNIIANKTTTSGSTLAFSIRDGYGGESIGVGIQDLVVEGNIIYNMRAPSSVAEPLEGYLGGPIPTIENVDFIDNDFQEPNASYTGLLLDIFDDAAAVNSFAGGRYYKAGSGNPFDNDGTTRTYAQFISDTGESGSSNALVSYTAPSRSCDSYAVAEGYDDWADLVDAATSRGLGEWDDSWTATKFNAYIRAGFAT